MASMMNLGVAVSSLTKIQNIAEIRAVHKIYALHSVPGAHIQKKDGTVDLNCSQSSKSGAPELKDLL